MMSMIEFKKAMKNDAMKQEYEAYIDQKKPETLEALAETVVDFAAASGFYRKTSNCIKRSKWNGVLA